MEKNQIQRELVRPPRLRGIWARSLAMPARSAASARMVARALVLRAGLRRLVRLPGLRSQTGR